MSAPQQVVDRVHMWGHEMLTSSDQTSGRSASSSALLATVLTQGVGTGTRVLLVGPHDARLLEALVDREADVDVVLRSWPDASELAARHGDEVRVHCGGWDRFDPEDRTFDLVLVPDGLERIWGPESRYRSWPETVRGLRGLAPGGSVELGVRNELTESALWSLDVSGPSGDDEWPLPDGVRLTPPSPGALGPEHGDVLVRSLYPHLRHPLAAVPAEVFDRAGDDPRLRRVLVDAFVGDADRSVLRRDPRPLVDLALAQGHGEALAPGWLVRLGRPASTPLVHACDVKGGGATAVVLELEVDGGDWTRTVRAAAGPVQPRGPHRQMSALTGHLPAGRTLEEALLEACAAHDLAEVRGLVRTYADWLHGAATERDWTAPWDDADRQRARVVDGVRTTARLDDLLAGAGGDVVDAGWRLDWAVPADVALTASLVRFADRLVSSGARHPFAPATPPAVMARSLAAMAAHAPDEQTVARAVRLLDELDQSASPWRRTGEGPGIDTGRRPWGSADFHGIVELDQALSESTRALAAAQEQVEWLLARVVREDRRRRAMLLRAREAERRLGWRLRLTRRIRSSRVVRALDVLSVKEHGKGSRWSPPTDEGLAGEIDEVREAMREATRSTD